MTNQIALVLGVVLVLAIGADLAIEDGAGLIFLAQKLDALIEWLAFWR
jgi:hypothetical protein